MSNAGFKTGEYFLVDRYGDGNPVVLEYRTMIGEKMQFRDDDGNRMFIQLSQIERRVTLEEKELLDKAVYRTTNKKPYWRNR